MCHGDGTVASPRLRGQQERAGTRTVEAPLIPREGQVDRVRPFTGEKFHPTSSRRSRAFQMQRAPTWRDGADEDGGEDTARKGGRNTGGEFTPVTTKKKPRSQQTPTDTPVLRLLREIRHGGVATATPSPETPSTVLGPARETPLSRSTSSRLAPFRDSGTGRTSRDENDAFELSAADLALLERVESAASTQRDPIAVSLTFSSPRRRPSSHRHQQDDVSAAELTAMLEAVERAESAPPTLPLHLWEAAEPLHPAAIDALLGSFGDGDARLVRGVVIAVSRVGMHPLPSGGVHMGRRVRVVHRDWRGGWGEPYDAGVRAKAESWFGGRELGGMRMLDFVVAGEWLEPAPSVGSLVHVVFTTDPPPNSPPSCITPSEHAWILHPDVLLPPTRITDALHCLRRAVLQERLASDPGDTSRAALWGQLKHALLEEAVLYLSSEQRGAEPAVLTERWLQDAAANLLAQPSVVRSLAACARAELRQGVPKAVQKAERGGEGGVIRSLSRAARRELHASIPAILAWCGKHVWSSVGAERTRKGVREKEGRSASAPPGYLRVDEPGMAIESAVSTEERVWSPLWGLKGVIDALVVASPDDGDGEDACWIPLELKTGRPARNGGMVLEHRAQVSLYSLLVQDRYPEEGGRRAGAEGRVSGGILLYLAPGQRKEEEEGGEGRKRDGHPVHSSPLRLSQTAPATVNLSQESEDAPLPAPNEPKEWIVPAVWAEQRSLLVRRNALADAIVRVSSPPPDSPLAWHLPRIDVSPRMCERCYVKTACSTWATMEAAATHPRARRLVGDIEDLVRQRRPLAARLSEMAQDEDAEEQDMFDWSEAREALLEVHKGASQHVTPRMAVYLNHWMRLLEWEGGEAAPAVLVDGRPVGLLSESTARQRFVWAGERTTSGPRDGCVAVRARSTGLGGWRMLGEGEEGNEVTWAMRMREGGDEGRPAWDEWSEGERMVVSVEGRAWAVGRGRIARMEAGQDEVRVTLVTAVAELLRRFGDDCTWRIDREEMPTNTRTLRDNVMRLVSGPTATFTGATGRTRHRAVEETGDVPRQRVLVNGEAPTFRLPRHWRWPWEPDSTPLPPTPIPPPPSASSHPLKRLWERLNEEQQAAVEQIFAAEDFALVQGMPGTGKSTLLAFVLRLAVAMGQRVLLTAYTHSAVDTVLQKLQALEDEDRTLPRVRWGRLGSPSSVHPAVRPWCLDVDAFGEEAGGEEEEEEAGGGGEEGKAIGMRRAQSTPADWWFQVRSCDVIGCTCLGAPRAAALVGESFDLCIVDEASQLSEPATIGPLRWARRFVLVGDHLQLPPLVSHPVARQGGLDVSLFRRLAEQHPQAVARLCRQYRMNRVIEQIANRLMYGGELAAGSGEVSAQVITLPRSESLGACPDWARKALSAATPVVWLDADGQEEAVGRRGGGFINRLEVDVIVRLARLLLECGVDASMVGVIAPYRAQLHALQSVLPAEVESGTVDRFQGRDKEILLISCVRNNAEGTIGRLWQDRRRVNVAVTRARAHLLFVGSRRTFLAAQDRREEAKDTPLGEVAAWVGAMEGTAVVTVEEESEGGGGGERGGEGEEGAGGGAQQEDGKGKEGKKEEDKEEEEEEEDTQQWIQDDESPPPPPPPPPPLPAPSAAGEGRTWWSQASQASQRPQLARKAPGGKKGKERKGVKGVGGEGAGGATLLSFGVVRTVTVKREREGDGGAEEGEQKGTKGQSKRRRSGK